MSVKVFHKVAVPTHGLVREFNEELHGKDYKEVAKSYVANYAGNVESVEGLDADETPSERDLLKEEATSLGIEFKANISTAKLAEAIAAKKAE